MVADSRPGVALDPDRRGAEMDRVERVVDEIERGFSILDAHLQATIDTLMGEG